MTSTKTLVKHLLNNTSGECLHLPLRYFVMVTAFNLSKGKNKLYKYEI